LLIVEFELKEYDVAVMHLPDPSYVAFVNAVIATVTAAIGVIRLILEKKRESPEVIIPGVGPSKKTLPFDFVR